MRALIIVTKKFDKAGELAVNFKYLHVYFTGNPQFLFLFFYLYITINENLKYSTILTPYKAYQIKIVLKKKLNTNKSLEIIKLILIYRSKLR